MKKLAIAIVLILLGAILSVFYAIQERKQTVDVVVTVHAKDTLWGICEREAALVGDKRDTREVIYETCIANDIKDGGAITPGQVIKVRVREDIFGGMINEP